ncbi:MAG: DUF4296 domain-containing protein [Sediminibacterium sp.]|jgi:hypothetical protein
MRNILFILVVLFAACNLTNNNKPVVAFPVMQKVIWQLMKSEDYYTRISLADSNLKGKHKNIELYEQVFQLNEINAKDFYATIDYYEKHPILFKELMDSVSSLSKRENLNTIRPLIK